jgi:hypothetical protein
MPRDKITMFEEIKTFDQLFFVAMGKKTPEEQILKEIEKRIKRGDDINQQIDGSSTPVMSAAAAGYLSVVNLFIQSGADLTLKNKWKEDVLKSAKYSESKEMVALVKGALKGANATEEPATVYYQPKLKTEAEYTFTPNKKFKTEHDSEEADVGFFLNDGEVLTLNPTKPVSTKAGTTTISIDEGKVTIKTGEWEEKDEKSLKPLLKKGKVELHGIDHIVQEYLSNY